MKNLRKSTLLLMFITLISYSLAALEYKCKIKDYLKFREIDLSYLDKDELVFSHYLVSLSLCNPISSKELSRNCPNLLNPVPKRSNILFYEKIEPEMGNCVVVTSETDHLIKVNYRDNTFSILFGLKNVKLTNGLIMDITYELKFFYQTPTITKPELTYKRDFNFKNKRILTLRLPLNDKNNDSQMLDSSYFGLQ